MPLRQSDLIEVRLAGPKGRGVFAREHIAKGTVIERVPVIVLPASDIFSPSRDVRLARYVFDWDEETVALALGYGSLYNHSFQPNAYYYGSGASAQIFMALRDIAPGEEITVNYNGRPRSRKAMSFPVHGSRDKTSKTGRRR